MADSVKNLPDDLYPSSMDCNLEFNNTIHQSPWNKNEQIERKPGERWVFKFDYADLEQEQARRLHAFLVSLRGVAGRFYAKDYAFFERGGSISGNPKVDGTDNTGSKCKIKDCPPNRVIFKAGDYAKISGRLHMITEDIRSDGLGKALLVFEPRMITLPTNNASVVYNDFTVICRLKDDKQGKRSSKDMSNKFGFECLEIV